MSIPVMLQQMGVIVILVSIGIYLEKKGIVDKLTSPKLSAIVVDVCNPALIMASILSGNITATHKDLINAVILGAVFYVVLMILGFILPFILRSQKTNRRFYNLMTVYTNIGFLGIPVAKAILPENAILYVIVLNIFYSVLFYTHGISILSSEHGKISLRSILNPGTIMAVLSLVVFWFGIELPPIISNTIQYTGNATIFLSMALLGVSIARSHILDYLTDLRIWAYIGLRMILLPILIVPVMSALKFDTVAIQAMCLMASVPVGNLPMIQAEKIGEDTRILSSAIALSTIVSMITIPLLLSLSSAFLMG